MVSLRSWFRARALLEVEMLALRHQVAVLKRSQRGRLRLSSADQLLWVGLYCFWPRWRSALLIVRPYVVQACRPGDGLSPMLDINQVVYKEFWHSSLNGGLLAQKKHARFLSESTSY